MKNFFRSLCFVLMLVLGFGLVSFAAPKTTQAHADTEATESACADVWINEMSGLVNAGAAHNNTTGNISLTAGTRFAYGPKYKNVIVRSNITFTSDEGNLPIKLRAQGTPETFANANSWDANDGYMFMWYSHGQFEIYKNGAKILDPTWTYDPKVGDTYEVALKTVDLSDGSVKFEVFINGTSIYNYVDTENPITGAGYYSVQWGGLAADFSGEGFSTPIFNLSDVASPVTSNNFPGATVDANGVVTTNYSDLALGHSGVGYTFYNDGSGYGYKVAVTPTGAAGRLIFSIGSYKNTVHEMNRPQNVSTTDDGCWDDAGYVLYWSSNGQRHLARGNDNTNLLEYAWNAVAYQPDTTYNVEFSMQPYADGSVRVTFRINGALVVNYLDVPSTGYTPVKLVQDASGTGHVTNCLLMTAGVNATFAPIDPISVEEKTVITNDLGAGVSPTSTFDRNGAVSNMTGALSVGWNANITNTVIKFTANFKTAPVHAPLHFMIGYKGNNLDQYAGGDWTRKGYALTIYPNGMTGMRDNGELIVPDGWTTWAFAGTGIAVDQPIEYEIGISTDGESYTRVWLKANQLYMFNYVDTTNPVLDGGWFAINNQNGATASLTPYGIDVPTIDTDIAAGTQVNVGDEVTLSYALTNPTGSDTVEYYVDTTKSTANATIEGDKVVATTGGNVVVYAKVNGIYSEDLVYSVVVPEYAEVFNLPTAPLIVGGQNATVDARLSTGVAITTKVFEIENISGRATIDAATGEIVAVAAGTVKVYATVNGIKSQGYILTILPKLEVNHTTALAVGSVIPSLGYTANCDLPEETITATYEIVEGASLVDFDPATGRVVAKGVGIIGVRVTLTGETFQAVSEIARIAIEEPIVINHHTAIKDIHIGQTITLEPRISQAGIETTSVSLVFEEGADCVTVAADGVTITGKKAGTVRFKAKVNGITSNQASEFVVYPLVPTIILGNVPVGITQTISVMFNSKYYTPTNIVYSILEGADKATIEGDKITATEIGKVKIKAVIDDTYEATLTINITGRVVLRGVNEGQDVLVGSKIQLDYHFYQDADNEEEITSVKYVLVSGSNIATLTEDGLLYVHKIGQVKVKVVVNGIDSQVIAVTVYKNTSKLVGWIVFGSILVVCVLCGAAAGTVFVVKKVKTSKATATEAPKAEKETEAPKAEKAAEEKVEKTAKTAKTEKATKETTATKTTKKAEEKVEAKEPKAKKATTTKTTNSTKKPAQKAEQPKVEKKQTKNTTNKTKDQKKEAKK